MEKQPRITTPLPDEPYYQHLVATVPKGGVADQPGARPGSGRRAGLALIIVGLLWLVLMLGGRGLRTLGGGNATVLQQTFSAQAISMDVGAADVELQRGSDSGIQILATQRGGLWNSNHVQVDTEGGALHVTNTQTGMFSWFGGRQLHYIVSVPANAQVQVNTTSGTITVDDIDGGRGDTVAMSLHSISGDIEASNVSQNLTIATTTGDTTLRAVDGSLKITSTSGDVHLEDSKVRGATIATTSGDINVQGVTDALDVQSVSGDISVEDAAPTQLRLNTTSGDIDYTGNLAASGSNNVSGGSGDVTLSLPSDSGFHIQATTINGELSVDDDFHMQQTTSTHTTLDARVGNGSAPLTVQTTSGDIDITQQ